MLGAESWDKPVDPAADQHGVDRRGQHSEPPTDLDRAQALLPPQVRDLADHRRRRPRRGLVGRLGRQVFAALDDPLPGRLGLTPVTVRPALRGRPGHPNLVGRLSGRPLVIDDQPIVPKRWTRVGAALGWDTNTSWLGRDELDSSTPHEKPSPIPRSHDLVARVQPRRLVSTTSPFGGLDGSRDLPARAPPPGS